MPAQLADALEFNNGATLKNRFVLAPLTNLQSAADGVLSDDEYRWLTYRAEGGFGLTMTCASHVQKIGQGFPGQLGVFSDDHLPGLTRLAAAIKARSPAITVMPGMSAGATDSLYFRALGVPSYGVSSLFMKAEDGFAHGLNERVPVAGIGESLLQWDTVLRALAK